MAGYRGQQGRKRTPQVLKILRGNPGRRPLNENEPQPDDASLDPPEWLTPEGYVVWREYAPKLSELGLLTVLDVELFGHACALSGVARALPPGSADHVKLVAAANRILSRFGFTPSDRGELSVNPMVEGDGMEAFLGRKP